MYGPITNGLYPVSNLPIRASYLHSFQTKAHIYNPSARSNNTINLLHYKKVAKSKRNLTSELERDNALVPTVEATSSAARLAPD
jgi:hypothetical protein